LKSPYVKLFNQYERLYKNKEGNIVGPLRSEDVKTIKNRIYEHYKQKIMINITDVTTKYESFKNIYEKEEFTKTEKDEKFEAVLTSLYNLNMSFSIAFFDTYTIGRLLKSIYVYDSKLSIIYAGGGHIMNYSDIFIKLNIANEIRNIFNFDMERFRRSVDLVDPQPYDIYNCTQIITAEHQAEWQKIVSVLENLPNQ
jgi:ASC-1-like (ASCH) protein